MGESLDNPESGAARTAAALGAVVGGVRFGQPVVRQLVHRGGHGLLFRIAGRAPEQSRDSLVGGIVSGRPLEELGVHSRLRRLRPRLVLLAAPVQEYAQRSDILAPLRVTAEVGVEKVGQQSAAAERAARDSALSVRKSVVIS